MSNKLLVFLFLLINLIACSGDNVIANRTTVKTLKFPDNQLQGSVKLTQVFSAINVGVPVFLTAAGDGTDRIFVVDKAGIIRVFQNQDDVATSNIFLDRSSVTETDGEQGMLGLAFDPNYSSNGYFYVYYCLDGGSRRTRVSRFHVSSNPDQADAASELILFEVSQPATNHKGGFLTFGPDGYLYVSLGDGGSTPESGQDMTTLRGKILRIDVAGGTIGTPYHIPSDNPFVGVGGGVREEIWAFGFRNPWRMSFDRVTNQLWIADVGQNLWEEIDIGKKGGNFGWQNFEANHVYNNSPTIDFATTQAPIWEYSHNGGAASITGGYVYRGTNVGSLVGKYVYADYIFGTIWTLDYAVGQTPINTELASLANVIGFGQDTNNELYVLTSDGNIYRFEENSDAATSFPQQLSKTGIFKNLKTLEVNPGIIAYDLNQPFWSDGLLKRRWLALPGSEQIIFSATDRFKFPVGTVTIKHFDWDLGNGKTKKIETRVFIYHKDGWAGYTYKWNDAQTDATLISKGETLNLTEGKKSLHWPLPSRGQCMGCHTQGAEFVLGLETAQLNRDFEDRGNQLKFFNDLQLFPTPIEDPNTYNVYPAIDDESVDLETRAKTYLHVNCSSCHRPGENNLVGIDFRFTTALKDMHIRNVSPNRGDLGVANAKRLYPGHKEKSIIYLRMIDQAGHRMPPFGTNKVDTKGAKVVGDWINDL